MHRGELGIVIGGLVDSSRLRERACLTRPFGNLRDVVTDPMNEAPKTTDHAQFDPLPERLEHFVKGLCWIAEARVRLREEGHVCLGEVFVVVNDPTALVTRLDDATRQCLALDWRLHDIVLVPVSTLDPQRIAGTD